VDRLDAGRTGGAIRGVRAYPIFRGHQLSLRSGRQPGPHIVLVKHMASGRGLLKERLERGEFGFEADPGLHANHVSMARRK
jgi:hypothetical protein